MMGRLAVGENRFAWQAAAWTILWALMPDLIDKPLFKLGLNPVWTSRLWGHSLLACVLAVVLARFIIKSSWPWVLAMPGHLLLDSMWERPHTLLWPFLGNTFDLGPLPCPPEIFARGYLAMYQWRWQTEAHLVAAILAAEIFGFILFLAAVRHLGGRPAAGESRLWAPLR
jgi:membrane-bound metal-dependent hydrolase YbcI (DUF457 family)